MSTTTKTSVIYEGELWSLRTYPNSFYCCTTLVLVPPPGVEDPRKRGVAEYEDRMKVDYRGILSILSLPS